MTTKENVSRIAASSASSAMIAVLMSLGGVVAAYSGLASAFGGFVMMALGLLSASVGLVTGLVGLATTRPSRGLGGRGSAVVGIALSTLVLAAIFIPASAARDLPRINDITTDLDNPPVFVAAKELESNLGRDMSYPGESFARQQMAAYSDLGAVNLNMEPKAALEVVTEVIEGLPATQIIDIDVKGGRLEAMQKSNLFHFVDDFVLRVVAREGGGSKVDMRSKSRDGQGDLGANAKRIRTVFSLLEQHNP